MTHCVFADIVDKHILFTRVMSSYIIRTYSPEMTYSVGFALGRHLKSGYCVSLAGNIGSGKTCMIQGIARGLGVPDDVHVTSPSFTLINRYSGRMPVYHIDLYRLNNQSDLDGFEIDEILDDNGVVLIEWPELASSRLTSIALRIYLYWDMTDEFQRRLEFYDDTNRFDDFFTELKHAFPGN